MPKRYIFNNLNKYYIIFKNKYKPRAKNNGKYQRHHRIRQNKLPQ